MTTRFMQKGLTRFYLVPTIANQTTLLPTVAEVAAGTRIDTQLAEVSGFSFANETIETPDMSSTFDKSIPGGDKADASSLTNYELKTSDTIKTALAKGTNAYIVIFPYGTAGATPAIADKCDVWPVTIASRVRAYSAGNEASKYTASFAMTAEPKFELTLAA